MQKILSYSGLQEGLGVQVLSACFKKTGLL